LLYFYSYKVDMAFKITIYFGMDQNLIVVYSKVNGNFKSHVNFKIIIKKKKQKNG
jgi:lipid-A-disaccharide synthase-like uncharacterized protein